MSRIKRSTNQYGNLPRAGKIKVGILAENGNTSFPKGIDYFRATGDFATVFHKIYGEEPKEIVVQFISDDLEKVCNERQQIRNAQGKVFAWGDGEFFQYIDPKTQQIIGKAITDVEGFKQRALEHCSNSRHQAQWQEVLTLRFIIPNVPVMGLWELETKGKDSSLQNLRNAFDVAQSAAGSIVGIKFRMKVEIHVSDKAIARRYPVISMFPELSAKGLEMLQSVPVSARLNALRTYKEEDLKALDS